MAKPSQPASSKPQKVPQLPAATVKRETAATKRP